MFPTSSGQTALHQEDLRLSPCVSATAAKLDGGRFVVRTIPLTQGKVALVDDADFDWLNQWKWHYVKAASARNGYAFGRRSGTNNRTGIYMHRQILGLQSGNKLQADHINGDGLDNRRSNLRLCTHQQNMQNRSKWKVGASQYKGVRWAKKKRKWRARIRMAGNQLSLGYYDDEKAAALAYNNAAIEHFGEFARLNDVLSGKQPQGACLLSKGGNEMGLHKRMSSMEAELTALDMALDFANKDLAAANQRIEELTNQLAVCRQAHKRKDQEGRVDRQRIEELEAALQETIETVKQWHRISYSARYRQLIEECREALEEQNETG